MAPIGSKATFTDFIASLDDRGATTSWFQFREATDPQWVGEYLSAVSNGAALAGRPFGYVIWGVDAGPRTVHGTNFLPGAVRTGGDSLTAWLRRGLRPNVWFEFHHLVVDSKAVVVLEVEAAQKTPVGFDDRRWIRTGDKTKLLHQEPDIEQDLWRQLLHLSGDSSAAVRDCASADVVDLIDVDLHRRLSGHRDKRRAAQLDRLVDDRIVTEQSDGGYTIHRHGALLFAHDLRRFVSLEPKAIRLSQFGGTNRLAPLLAEEVLTSGYASSFRSAMEIIERWLSRRALSIPAVREMLMNAVVHQDLDDRHAGPTVDVFSDRVEVSNPGAPLGAIDRLLDERPLFRNKELARLLFQLGFCDRRGSGIDRIVAESEALGGPPPTFVSSPTSFTVTLRDRVEGRRLAKGDRIEAMYLHTVLHFISGSVVSNESVRDRFGLTDAESSLASRYIRETFLAGRIAKADRGHAAGGPQYVPYWASSPSS